MKSAHFGTRALFAALLIALPITLGLTCEDLVAKPTGTAPPVTLRPKLAQIYQIGGSTGLIVDLVVSVDAPIQAVDMTLKWDAPTVLFAAAIPNAAFDDDGALFDPGVVTANSVEGIVELRHGPSTLKGNVRVASVGLLVQDRSQPVTFRSTGDIVGPNGTRYEVVIQEALVLPALP